MKGLVLLWIGCIIPCSLFSGAYTYTDENQGNPIGKHTSYLLETEGQNFQDVLNSEDFIQSTDVVPNYGILEGAVWIRFEISNQSKETELVVRLAYPILDEVTFFTQNKSGQWDSVFYSEKTDWNLRQYSESSYGYKLNLPQNGLKTCFIRIRSSEQIIVPITVHSDQGYWAEAKQDGAINAFYAGIVAIMIIYNLFVFYSVKDRSYIYYVLYLLFIGLTQLGIKGYIPLSLLSLIPGFHDYSLVLFGSMGAMFGVIFTRDFLHTNQNLPRVDLVLKLTIPLFILSSVLSVSGMATLGFILMQLGTSISAVTIFVASILAVRKGVPSSKYFTIAWTTLLVSAIIFLLKDVGVLPYNVLTNFSMQAGSAIEMSLLSFALANKINILQEESRVSREREVDALKKNEKLIKEQNVVLEQKVEERTQDLQVANDSLEGTLSTLKSAQSQLVSQEKMASLGQLTAGIAHEINNPINFVSSNVNPLRRDFDDLKEIIGKYEELTHEENQQEDIIPVLKKLKDEIDYPYVLEEIDQLLNGIQDGADRTAEIVKSLKNFSRLDEVESKFANVHDGIRSTLIILKSGNKENVKIETKFDESIKPIECYPGKLNQVFSNVIINSIQALSKETFSVENPEILISTKQLEDGISISIKDNGPGIPEDQKDKIFEPFFTTKDVGEGTGLGLSIVFSIIESHNGTIDVISPSEGGTEFLITLPRTIH